MYNKVGEPQVIGKHFRVEAMPMVKRKTSSRIMEVGQE